MLKIIAVLYNLKKEQNYRNKMYQLAKCNVKSIDLQ